MSMTLEYMLPYMLPNIHVGVYYLDCEFFSANHTLLRTNSQVFMTGLGFTVKSILSSTLFYPLLAVGLIREGEVRRFECISDELFVLLLRLFELGLSPRHQRGASDVA